MQNAYDYYVRRFEDADAEEVSLLVAKTLREVNSKDYSKEYIEANVISHSAEVLIERAEDSHMYVVCDGDKIIGCGAIAGYWGSTTESILLTIFVLPEYQKRGVGKKIIATLEADEYFTRAKRIEIPASITAVDFYMHMGYGYKGGVKQFDEEEQVYRLEKIQVS